MPVVFYCSSMECMSGPQAAQRAMGAGYENVSCLKVGIKGWTEAGQAVSKFEAPTAAGQPQKG